MIVDVSIKGVTPLLMHKFCEEDLLPGRKSNKNLTPREMCERFAYKTKGDELYMPAENIFACIISAGQFHKLGKNKVTTQKSSLIPAGITILDDICLFNSKSFEVDSRSVVIPSTGGRVMQHRPRLDAWELSFSLEIDANMFQENMVREIMDDAGSKCGLGDFRPNRKGRFGKFKVTKWEVKK